MFQHWAQVINRVISHVPLLNRKQYYSSGRAIWAGQLSAWDAMSLKDGLMSTPAGSVPNLLTCQLFIGGFSLGVCADFFLFFSLFFHVVFPQGAIDHLSFMQAVKIQFLLTFAQVSSILLPMLDCP